MDHMDQKSNSSFIVGHVIPYCVWLSYVVSVHVRKSDDLDYACLT